MRGEVARVGTEVAEQPACGKSRGNEQPEKEQRFRRLVVACEPDDEDERAEADHE